MKFFEASEYQPLVQAKFEALKAKLSPELPHAELEHVGSSSMHGAISKGDLDLLVRVSKTDFASALATLQALGFSIKRGTLRTESLCMLEGPDDVAIQLIERGSKFEMFVTFRDRLNSNPELVEKYNALKRSCEGLSPDEYRARKSVFIESVLKTP